MLYNEIRLCLPHLCLISSIAPSPLPPLLHVSFFLFYCGYWLIQFSHFVHMCKAIEPASTAWEFYQQLHPPSRAIPFKYFLYLFYMYRYFLVCMYRYNISVLPLEAGRRHWSLGIRVTNNCELPYVCSGLNSGPLEAQPVLLITETSL